MSRSHRKPYFREENKKPKKKLANKVVRNISEDVPEEAHYRKLYDSYNIDDFGWLTKNPKLERKQLKIAPVGPEDLYKTL